MLKEFIGKKVDVKIQDVVATPPYRNCTILDVDSEWVKLEMTNRKGIKSITVLRIDAILYMTDYSTEQATVSQA